MVKKKKQEDKRPFSERHPKLSAFYGLLLLVGIGVLLLLAIDTLLGLINKTANEFIHFLAEAVNNLDAVVIVALITGAVSIVGVIISSIVAKIIDYKKNRKAYLAQKREDPYGQFVDMVYKIQANAKNENSYTEKEMLDDLSKFSKQITLWGSSNVVNKWVQFRENCANPEDGKKNLFLLEEIMNEMRKDLGLRKVKKGNLLAFFVNDIKQAMKIARK